MKLTDELLEKINCGKGCTVIKTAVAPDAAEDKSLPTNSYLIELDKEGDKWFDIAMGNSVDIFDQYFDALGHCIKKMSYCKGTIRPSLYNVGKPRTKKQK